MLFKSNAHLFFFCKSCGKTKLMINLVTNLSCIFPQRLLTEGADTAAINSSGDTALTLAQGNEDEKYVRLLQHAGDGSAASP